MAPPPQDEPPTPPSAVGDRKPFNVDFSQPEAGTGADAPRPPPPRIPKYADLSPLSNPDSPKHLDLSQVTNVHNRPCGREGLLTGVGAGTVMGAVRFTFGTPIPKAANWAVGTFFLGSLAGFEYCKFKRRARMDNTLRQVEVFVESQKEAHMAAEQEKAAQETRRKEEEMRLADERRINRKWYNLWDR